MLRQTVARLGRRSYTTQVSDVHVAALDRWISSDKKLVIHDTLRPEHLSSLYVTLPTRDGSQKPFVHPRDGSLLEAGHHLVFFHPRNPEKALRSDGTDADFCPPEPFTRRMWAGGRIEWRNPLLIGDEAVSVSTIDSVQKKGFEKGRPMVFVNQKIQYSKAGSEDVAIQETRSHVYLASPGNSRGTREGRYYVQCSLKHSWRVLMTGGAVPYLPVPDFSLRYLPTPTTLFRFSALTFNGHYIHLDRDYAQKSEGYPGKQIN